MAANAPIVVKVGGSLYDLPDLGARLTAFLGSLAPRSTIILVPGGGALVDAIRLYDSIHHLGEEACHWLALRTLTINAQFLAHLLPGATIISDVEQRAPGLGIVDGYAFAVADEVRPGKLPHSWAVTSDSLAARVAMVSGAREVVLLKSLQLASGATWPEAARLGLVDDFFCQAVPADLAVRFVDLRTSPRSPEASG